ncbi:unnamed protein product [Trichobilharzia szidati]|nr:unnamed protein product [Trichobilharzia szidati]
MTRRVDVNSEPYAAYLAPSQIPQINPTNVFYTTDGQCKRYYCAVCGECHPVNTHRTQRLTEWLTGTTLPDALHRSSEAKIIDDFTQLRFHQARTSNNDDHPCTITERMLNQARLKEKSFKPC